MAAPLYKNEGKNIKYSVQTGIPDVDIFHLVLITAY
jgi:hypothetical protein